MKRSVIYTFLLSITLLGACNKQLEEYNPSGLTVDQVFSTPDGFETLVTAAYSYNRWWYGKEEGYSIAEMGTDLWTSGTGDKYSDLTQYLNLQASNSVMAGLWKQLYAAVNLCNLGIARVDKAGFTDNIRVTRDAELRFLRAFYYWHIVETWGGVHFTTQPTEGVVTTANRTPVDTFYAQIFRDLEVAVTNLPATTGDYGRVTKPAAQAFLARICLTRGLNQRAAVLADSVINNYSFALESNYARLWSMDNLQNKEVVWAVNYMKNLVFDDRTNATLYPTGHSRGAHNGHLMFGMKYDDLPGMQRDIANGRPFNRYMPTLFMLNLYNENADARYEGSFRQVWYCNNLKTAPDGMKLGDTAVFCSKKAVNGTGKKYRIYDRNASYAENEGGKDRTHYVSLKKFDDPTRLGKDEEQSARDAFIIRLAELYLIAAEAQFNLGNSAKAADYINVIRKRAAIPGHEAEMVVSASDITLDFILDERARELVGEQLRWFDLKRTGKLGERISAHNPDAAKYFQSYHTLRPIPQEQIDAVTNKTEFTQNPNYQ
ncbi:RagB/SusD family nutrient uptake outer membrane protein [Chitinophaga tropicalis]|uniref:RagB/SusD family nutrient uptake outer membrane protein n=1 Tax=Chitinophaga tropicalis TaxID=2683588 RepID=A0A7K1U2T8_9BACT|nr:RagB/SusD family nutrient uptake outer membrane protein [Chitinophaga tropicalis]MVT08606.1 RagB/SusD family nutrient uptake outer membrane protein [Chitinophaga tropicalis]